MRCPHHHEHARHLRIARQVSVYRRRASNKALSKGIFAIPFTSRTVDDSRRACEGLSGITSETACALSRSWGAQARAALV